MPPRAQHYPNQDFSRERTHRNTVARMVSGALGVAVIGSLISSLLLSNQVDGTIARLPAKAQASAEESVGAAGAITAQLPGDAAAG